MLSLLLHWLTQMSSFAPEGSCTCWLCKVPALITSALLSYSKNDWLPRVLPWYPHATYLIRASIIFHSFHWYSDTSICYVWSNIDHVITLVTVNLDNLDSPRKCVSVASTLAPLRASLWWTFQHAPRWKDVQVRSTPLEKGCSVDAGFGAFPSGRFLQVFRHFAFVQKAFQVLTSRSLYFYLGIDG